MLSKTWTGLKKPNRKTNKMSDLTIKTNNQPRDILSWWDLTYKEWQEFDYIDTEDEKNDANFFRYRGRIYDLGEYMRIENNPDLKDWDGYNSNSYFSGTLVRYTEDNERVIVATYYS